MSGLDKAALRALAEKALLIRQEGESDDEATARRVASRAALGTCASVVLALLDENARLRAAAEDAANLITDLLSDAIEARDVLATLDAVIKGQGT
jgi:hypothetical protein